MIKVRLKLLLMTSVFLLMNVVHLMPLLMTIGILCAITNEQGALDNCATMMNVVYLMLLPMIIVQPPVNKVHMMLLPMTTGTLCATNND